MRLVVLGLSALLLAGCASESVEPIAEETISPRFSESPEPTQPEPTKPESTLPSESPEVTPTVIDPVQLQICDFSTADAASPNPNFPFDFMLTTELENSTDPNVRAAVTSVQELLKVAGFTGLTGAPTLPDGSYGPNTAHAVQTFQQQAGLVVDGKVGPETWKALGTQYCWYFH